MENKKFNLFAILLIVVMAVFTIYTSINSNKSKDGRDGMSAYELAVSNGEFSGTELEYLLSLQGKDGSNVTLDDIYNAYLKETNQTTNDVTFIEFITSYFDKLVLDENTEKTLVEYATNTALRSTVDICYSDYMETPIIEVYENNGKYYLNESKNEQYAAISLSAGSGVIYQINSDSAYIITNYHVLYAENYSNDPNYRVYRKVDENGNESYFTATFNSSKLKNGVLYNTFGQVLSTKYINSSDVSIAPINTHFLDTYEIYLYGYQSADYAISATFVGGSADNDIAVLKVDKNSSNNNNKLLFNGVYKSADIADSTKLCTGRSVIAVGNPLLPNIDDVSQSTVKEYVENLEQDYIDALCLTSTSGEVSNVSEDRDFASLLEPEKSIRMRLIRVSAAINAGNSGGGLYDVSGRLVGIVNGKIVSEEYDNIGYAIPVNIAKRVADRIINQCDGVSGNTRTKIISASSLGIEVKDGNKSTDYDGKWILDNNVVIDSLDASKAAYKNGITKDSIIESIEINGITYDIVYTYDLNDVLLNIDIKNVLTRTIKFNLKVIENYVVVDKQITINLTDSDFIELI